jgi:hypothetical protein
LMRAARSAASSTGGIGAGFSEAMARSLRPGWTECHGTPCALQGSTAPAAHEASVRGMPR